MCKLHKRLTSLLLCVLFVITTAIPVNAEIGGGGTGEEIHWNPTAGGSSTATRGVTRGWGVRVTFTSSAALLESGVKELTGGYTEQDLNDQFQDILNVAGKRYIEPGVAGLNYYTGTKPLFGVESSENLSIRDIRSTRREMRLAAPIDDNLNKLAWMCYYTGENATTRPADATYAYNPTIADQVIGDGAVAASGDPGAWLDSVKVQVYAAAGESAGNRPSLSRLDQIIVTNGQVINDNFATFTWSSKSPVSEMGSAAQKVKWSKIGYITALMQLAWAAQEAGDAATYADMANKLASWAATGYTDSSQMPVVMFEATNCVSLDGSPDSGQWMMMTMPYLMQLAYGGAMASQLYAEWPEGCVDNTDNALLTLTKDLTCEGPRQCQVQQGLGYYPLNGTQIFTKAGQSWLNRTYWRNLWCIGGNPNLFGYIHNWTYMADTPPDGDPGNPNQQALGSFTWDLTPKDSHDMTPDTEVNASSTVYKINMSQSGHNMNNYATKWVPLVNSDGSNENQIRINVYRVSQALDNGQEATSYSRGSVKAAGQDVLHDVDRVVNFL